MKLPNSFMGKLKKSPFERVKGGQRKRTKAKKQAAKDKEFMDNLQSEVLGDSKYFNKADESASSFDKYKGIAKSKYNSLLNHAKNLTGIKLSDKSKHKVLTKLLEKGAFEGKSLAEMRNIAEEAYKKVARNRKIASGAAGAAVLGGAGYGMMSDSDGDE